MGSPLEELRVKANTPDFRLEPFIVSTSRWYIGGPHQLGAGIYCHGYSVQPFTGLELKMKPYNTFTMIWFYSDNNSFSCRNYIAMIVS